MTELYIPVTISTCDGQERVIDISEASLSVTLKDLIGDVGTDNAIPLLNITAKTFDKLSEYMKRHVEFPKEHEDYADKGLDEIAPWDIEYCASMDNGLLFDVILASNYLDIPSLLQLTCKTVAKKIKGKSSDEIREILKIEVDENQVTEMLETKK